MEIAMDNNKTSELDRSSFVAMSSMDLEKIDEHIFRSKTLWKSKFARNVFGGQLISHALVAASHDIPETHHVHSLHSYFLRGGKTDIPILYHVDNTRDGKTYCARSVKATQGGNVIFTMQASFKKEEPYRKTHQLPMPKVPFPDDLPQADETLDTLRDNDLISNAVHKFGSEYYDAFPLSIKWVDPAQFLFLKPIYPKRCLWMKAKGNIAQGLHQNIHKCCLAYMSDAHLLQTAILPMSPVSRKIIYHTSLDHSMWFHAPFQADEWLLYEIEAEHTSDGRTLCHGRIWDLNGNLVTTVAQEGVMRNPDDRSKL